EKKKAPECTAHVAVEIHSNARGAEESHERQGTHRRHEQVAVAFRQLADVPGDKCRNRKRQQIEHTEAFVAYEEAEPVADERRQIRRELSTDVVEEIRFARNGRRHLLPPRWRRAPSQPQQNDRQAEGPKNNQSETR